MLPNTKLAFFRVYILRNEIVWLYSEVILKPKQVLPDSRLDICKKERDQMCLQHIINCVISPLNALIENRISWLCESGIRASALDLKSFRLDDTNDESESICNFSNNIVFAHENHWCLAFLDRN